MQTVRPRQEISRNFLGCSKVVVVMKGLKRYNRNWDFRFAYVYNCFRKMEWILSTVTRNPSKKRNGTGNYENYSSRNMMQSVGLEMVLIVPNSYHCPFMPFFLI